MPYVILFIQMVKARAENLSILYNKMTITKTPWPLTGGTSTQMYKNYTLCKREEPEMTFSAYSQNT